MELKLSFDAGRKVILFLSLGKSFIRYLPKEYSITKDYNLSDGFIIKADVLKEEVYACGCAVKGRYGDCVKFLHSLLCNREIKKLNSMRCIDLKANDRVIFDEYEKRYEEILKYDTDVQVLYCISYGEWSIQFLDND